MSLWKPHLEHWGGTWIPPISTRLPSRHLCCQSRRKTWILYQTSVLGTSRRTGNLKFLWKLHGAPRDFFILGDQERGLAQGDQERVKQLAHTQRNPLPRHLKVAPLALMLIHSEGCHYHTIAHWYRWQCNGARQSDPNKHADHSPLDLRMLSLQYSTGHRRDLT